MDRSLERLKPRTRWLGRSIEFHPELDSTNARAELRARQGAPEGTVVLADRQLAGRGRLGRSFFSPPGVSLYLSVVLRPELPPDRLHEHIFAAALAVAEVAGRHVEASRIAIKWPNDVLIDGRKTSGINAPAEIRGGRTEFLVLGVGLNVNTPQREFPADLQEIATSLRIACGSALDRCAVAEALLEQLEAELDCIRQDQFPSVLERWRIYFRMRGRPVRIGGPGIVREREGIAEDVDADGALILRVPEVAPAPATAAERAASGAQGARHGSSAAATSPAAGRAASPGYTLERILAGDVSLLDAPALADAPTLADAPGEAPDRRGLRRSGPDS